MAAVDVFGNNCFTALVTNVVTTPAAGTLETWQVDSTTSFPQIGTGGTQQFRLTIGPPNDINPEIVICTQVLSASQIQVSRGAEGSPIKTHGPNTPVTHTLTAGAISLFLRTDTGGTLVGPLTVSNGLTLNWTNAGTSGVGLLALNNTTPGGMEWNIGAGDNNFGLENLLLISTPQGHSGSGIFGGTQQTAFGCHFDGTNIKVGSMDGATAFRNVLDDGAGSMTIAGVTHLNTVDANANNAYGGTAGGQEVLAIYGGLKAFPASAATGMYGFGISSASLEVYTDTNFNVWQVGQSVTSSAFSVGGASNGPGTAFLVKTKNNTLDDGSGSVIAANNITALNGMYGGSSTQLSLRPVGPTSTHGQLSGTSGGAWSTSDSTGATRNTLDDGAGNMTVSASITTSTGVVNGTGTNLTLRPQGGGNSGALAGNNSGAWSIYSGTGVSRTILDDGSGNLIMTSGGKIVLGNGSAGIGGGLLSGSGVPSNSIGSNGDYYFRTDTPGTAGQRIYAKSAGAWVATAA